MSVVAVSFPGEAAMRTSLALVCFFVASNVQAQVRAVQTGSAEHRSRVEQHLEMLRRPGPSPSVNPADRARIEDERRVAKERLSQAEADAKESLKLRIPSLEKRLKAGTEEWVYGAVGEFIRQKHQTASIRASGKFVSGGFYLVTVEWTPLEFKSKPASTADKAKTLPLPAEPAIASYQISASFLLDGDDSFTFKDLRRGTKDKFTVGGAVPPQASPLYGWFRLLFDYSAKDGQEKLPPRPKKVEVASNQPVALPEAVKATVVGRWRVLDSKGAVAMYMTVFPDLSAKRDHAPAPGKIEFVNGTIRLPWSDGYRAILQGDRDSLIFFDLGNDPEATWASPAKQVFRAVRDKR